MSQLVHGLEHEVDCVDLKQFHENDAIFDNNDATNSVSSKLLVKTSCNEYVRLEIGSKLYKKYWKKNVIKDLLACLEAFPL